jgi:outer membrane usher protein
MNVDVAGVQEIVVPYARSGVIVKFSAKRTRNALITLHQPDGTPVPAGTRVKMMPAGQEFIVARRGEVYLMGMQLENTIEVRWQAGSCSLAVAMPAGDSEARIGPLTCGGVAP